MDERAFRDAILDDPGDDGQRLIFADWLEDNGQPDRAEWVRASVRLAPLQHNRRLREYQEAAALAAECFRRCRPAWLEDVPGITRDEARGMWWLHAKSKQAVKRLGRLPWLGPAAAEGWLLGLAIDWCDGTNAEIAAGWPASSLALPLWVAPAPQISDAGLAFWLSTPGLYLLDLPGRAIDSPAIAGLGSARLRVLRALVPDGSGAALLDQIKRLTGLRKLSIHGSAQPADGLLAALSALPGLRELAFTYSLSLTDAGLQRLAGLRGLRRLRLRNCRGVTESGVTALQKALPSLKVER